MALPSGIYNVTYRKDMAVFRTWDHWAFLIAFFCFLAVIPVFASRSQLSTMIVILCTIISLHGLNLLNGYCGQVSIGHSAFMAVGAYTSAILCNHLGFSFWLAMPLGGLGAGLVGVLFGAPSFRVKGFYLAITTLGAYFIVVYAIVHLPSLTKGTIPLDVPPPVLFGYEISSDRSYYYLAMIACVVVTYFVKNITRTGVGRAWVAIRDNDLAAESMGISLFYYKMLAFFIGCFLAGIAGAFFGHYTQAISVEYFTLTDSIWYLGMLIVGGFGNVLGAIFGAIVVIVLREFVTKVAPIVSKLVPALGVEFGAAMGLFVLGFVIIIFLIYEPRGLAYRWEVLKNKFRLYPFPY